MLFCGPSPDSRVYRVSESSPRELITLILAARQTPMASYEQFERAFQRALGCDLDYARRLLGGSRRLRPRHINVIRDLLQIGDLDLELSPRELAIELELPRSAGNRLRQHPGVDFLSRTNDKRAVAQLFGLVEGYWQQTWWSFSKTSEQALGVGLCRIDGVDENNFITCRIYDVHESFSGIIFPVLNHLYFILEKDRLFDEIVVCITNRPDRAPPFLRGICLGLSGGLDEIHSGPAAGKMAFRYLGKTGADMQAEIGDTPDEPELEQHLVRTVPRYISKPELARMSERERARLQINRLDNTVAADAAPFALRVRE
jgi:hypothetical protein